MDKNIAMTSDWHCGSKVGLTPPHWNRKLLKNDVEKSNKFTLIRNECWNNFKYVIEKNKPIDILVVDGDIIDGLSDGSHGVDTLIHNRIEQAQMALDIIEFINPKNIIFTYGSSYHVAANGEEWEALIATQCGCKIGVHEWIKVNNIVFNIKHHCPQSSIPHGKATLLNKDVLWNMLWEEYKGFPGADVYIRGHVHSFFYYGDSKYLGMCLPALKALGEIKIAKKYNNIIDFGLVMFYTTSKGNYHFQPYVCNIKSQIPKVMEM